MINLDMTDLALLCYMAKGPKSKSFQGANLHPIKSRRDDMIITKQVKIWLVHFRKFTFSTFLR